LPTPRFDGSGFIDPASRGLISGRSLIEGSVHIWLDPRVLAKLKALCGPGESYSDVILRVAKGEGGNPMTTH
jgi:hypothetical protein